MGTPRWTLDRLLAVTGSIALLALMLPSGLYLVHYVSASAEQSLQERGTSLAQTLSRQLVDPLLLKDTLALHEILRVTASSNSEIRYVSIEDAYGTVVAHTFPNGHPVQLNSLWRTSRGQPTRFRAAGEPLLDVPAEILDGRLGTLHVGLSRTQAAKAANFLLLLVGAGFIFALLAILVGARLIAEKVSLPLRRLETIVSEFPRRPLDDTSLPVSGTREVASLGKHFTDMVRRLEALERERSSARERMIHAERLRALGELAAGLAHEIHNPLDGMQECVRYLQADPTKGPRAGKYLPMLGEGLERIARVMRQMLTLARSGQETSVEACSASEIVDSLAAMLKQRLDSESVQLMWTRPGLCECLCNRQSLSQALLNLVLNAVEAVDDTDHPKILIEAKCDSQWVYLAVEDNGPGVPEEQRHEIFEPFFTTKPVGKGTGLGLSISRQLVRATGGELELSRDGSTYGGARFVIRMPKAASQEPIREESQGENPHRR